MLACAIFYWDAKQRLDLLTTFRARIASYFANAHWDRHTNDWVDSTVAKETRRLINEDMSAVEVAVRFVGVDMIIDYHDPLGIAGRVDVLRNVFNFPRLGLPHRVLVDPLDRAIGVYRGWLDPLWRKLFNPFYWLGWVLYWIAEIPFRLLGAAGFDTAKVEGSIWGRATKLVIQVLTVASLALGVIEKLDLLDSVVVAIRKLRGA